MIVSNAQFYVDKEQFRRCPVKLRLAIIGPYPPPYGGVTIHLQRLRTLLVENNIPFIIYNAGTESSETDGSVVNVSKRRSFWMLGYTLFGKEHTIYLHAPRIEAFYAAYFMARYRAKTVMLCLHNGRTIERYAKNRFGRRILRTLFSPIKTIICVNQEMKSLLASIGIDCRKLHHYPAFLPPTFSPKHKELPDPEVVQFCRKHFPLITVNGRVTWHNKEDLYGFDLLIELAGRLKEYRNIGIVVCFSKLNDEDEKYLEYLKKKAGELGIPSKAFFWIKEKPFYPVLRFADIFLRPTNTDGDAISVREALYLGVPVVASDVVERPQGALTFKNRNIDDLEEKVRIVIENIGQNRTMPREYVCREKGGDIDAYLELLKNQFGGDS